MVSCPLRAWRSAMAMISRAVLRARSEISGSAGSAPAMAGADMEALSAMAAASHRGRGSKALLRYFCSGA